jgi:HK97 gp10 family phage protein
MNGEMKVEGMEEMKKKLATLEPAVRKKLVRKALRAGAKVVATQCKVDAPIRSGLLRSKIKVRAGKRKRNVIRMNVSIGKKDFQGDTFYAGFVDRGRKSGKRGSRNRRPIAGSRFLEKAFDKARPAAAKAIVETLREGFTPKLASTSGEAGGE